MTNNFFKNCNILRRKKKNKKLDKVSDIELERAELELQQMNKIINEIKKNKKNEPPQGQITIEEFIIGDNYEKNY